MQLEGCDLRWFHISWLHHEAPPLGGPSTSNVLCLGLFFFLPFFFPGIFTACIVRACRFALALLADVVSNFIHRANRV